jgi:lipoyl(octanoyl) transferase
MDADRRPLEVLRAGRVGYREGLGLQADLVERRRAGEIPDQLVLLEHPHVISLGTSAGADHVLADAPTLDALGVEVHESPRGGDVTYHGPGQLVGYAVLDLKPDRQDLHRYLRDLEEVLIRTLAAFSVEGRREPGFTGVWTEEGKVAAIGVRVSSGWITSHGFALNVATDLSYFGTIVPCGIQGRSVTSLETILGRAVDGGAVETEVVRHFAAVFGREPELHQGSSSAPSGAVNS